MRRISSMIAISIVLTILFLNHFGLNFDINRLLAADIISESGSLVLAGTIKEVKEVDDEYFRIVADTESAGKILLKVKKETDINIHDLPGRDMETNLELKRPDGASNPGEFDYDRYLRTEGIYLIGDCDERDIRFLEINRNFFKGNVINFVSNLKNGFYEKMKTITDERIAGLLSGMLFGDKDRMPEEEYESFRKNGTAHVLSVSGLHVGIIYGAINLLAGKRKRTNTTMIITILLLCLCALLASFSLSVMRAMFMISIHMIAQKIHCRYDMLSAAFITASVFLLLNPLTLFSTGFIFSFTAVISMAVIGGGIRRYIKSNSVIIRIMIPITAIQIGMIPVNAHLFNTFSLAAFLSNLPVIFLSSIMIPLGILSFLMFSIGFVPDPITDLLCRCCGTLGNMMCYYNDLTGAYGRLGFQISSPSICITIMFYLTVFLVFSEHSYLNLIKWKAVIIFIVAGIILITAMNLETAAKPEIVFLDVGQGDCIHIRTADNRNYLIDGGGSLFSEYDVGENVIYPYLMKNGVDHLDGVFISHMDADHYKGISTLNTMMDTGTIYLYEGYKGTENTVAERLNVSPDRMEYLGYGDSVVLGDDIHIDVIYPKNYEKLSLDEDDRKGIEDLNEFSLVLKLEYKGRSFLFTGDIGACESDIPGDYSCDVMKVPHHGSRFSSSEEFVENAAPKAAVIQVGRNNFGHPAKSVIERYMKKGIIVFRNDLDGAVLVYIDGENCRIEGYRSGAKYGL